MSLFLKIACVVVFAAVIIGAGKGYYAIASFFEGSFSMGFIVGFWFAVALVFVSSS
ncbi:putative TIM-barrel protein [Brucella ceti TE28753-12]|nr:putative TIM-barrel protein [Brucella ceti TE28753-12]ERM04321.1 hypothetical protein P408_12930 [Brucella abortus S99]ERM86926.1 hypothetical protein P865_05430 [Brucella abortus 82]EXU84876.1 hypothetical protein AX23_04440 [Brucella melitensis 548]